MSTGDEPMLSQISHDLAPIISGRSSKIIVSARGAYLAGNISALLDQLNDRQQQAFRLASLQLACGYTEQALRLLPADAPEHAFLPQVQSWLRHQPHHPDPSLLTRLVEQNIVFQNGFWRNNEISGYSSETPAADVLVRLALALNAPTLREVSNLTTETVIQVCWMELHGATPYHWHYRNVTPRYRRQFKWSALRYQLEAAWTLLRGHQPLAAGEYLHDVRRGTAPASGLISLTNHMDQRQRLAFRQLVIRQGLDAVLRYMPWAEVYPAEWACVRAVRQWVADPSEKHAYAASQQTKAIAYSLDPHTQELRRKLEALVDAIRASSEVHAAILAMEPFVPQPSLIEGDRIKWPEPLDTVQWWQIQAASSILAGDVPAPLWPDDARKYR